MKCERCPVPEPLVCTADKSDMVHLHLCDRLDEPGFSLILLKHAVPPFDEPETPDEMIARVEEMARRAMAGERRGCGGCP